MPDDDVSEIFKNGRVYRHPLINASRGEHSMTTAVSVQIVELPRAVWADQRERRNWLRFQLYSVPSENLCDRRLPLSFGVSGVTDRLLHTSFHLDAEKKANPHRQDFEVYSPLANGGFTAMASIQRSRCRWALEDARAAAPTHDRHAYRRI